MLDNIFNDYWEIIKRVFILTGKLRYANNSNYKNDVMIRKEVSFFKLSFELEKIHKCWQLNFELVI